MRLARLLRPLWLFLPCAALAVPASIVSISLPEAIAQAHPVILLANPNDTLEVEFPWSLADWAGRGFTTDPDRFAGDFAIAASRGSGRLFLTPLSEKAHRTLHCVLAPPGGPTLSIALEILCAPPALSWHKVIFLAPQRQIDTGERLSGGTKAVARRADPIEVLGTLRALYAEGTGERPTSRTRGGLGYRDLGAVPVDYGSFVVRPLFAVAGREGSTWGLCCLIESKSPRRILFDPLSWVVRSGTQVTRLTTCDFDPELNPGQASVAFIAGPCPTGWSLEGAYGSGTLRPSLRAAALVNPRPVAHFEARAESQ
jgi:hypothetical protein